MNPDNNMRNMILMLAAAASSDHFAYAETSNPYMIECSVETEFSARAGWKAADTKYIFLVDESASEVVKLQEGERPIAIDVRYMCRINPLLLYCERRDFGTYWTFELVRKDGSFKETIGTYSDTESLLLKANNGRCVEVQRPSDHAFPER